MKFVSFTILMQLLRDRDSFLEEINRGKGLDRKILSLLFCSSLFFALYGAIIGSIHGWLQMLSSAFKLPALFRNFRKKLVFCHILSNRAIFILFALLFTNYDRETLSYTD